jgi:hypothetical protein
MVWACPSDSTRPAAAATGQGVQAFGLVGGRPATDRFVADAQEFGEFELRVSQFESAQGAQPEDLDRFVREAACVGQFDGHGRPPTRVVAEKHLNRFEHFSCLGNMLTFIRINVMESLVFRVFL